MSSSVTKLMATPFLPKRPPRPILGRRGKIRCRFYFRDSKLCTRACILPMDVVLSVCRKVVVDNKGNLLHVNTTSLKQNTHSALVKLQTHQISRRKQTLTGRSGLTNKSVVISTRLDPDLNSLMMMSRSF